MLLSLIRHRVMDVILEWRIGFDQATTRDRIREEGFETFDDLLVNMKEKDIHDRILSVLMST
jgi:hypothetical protein